MTDVPRKQTDPGGFVLDEQEEPTQPSPKTDSTDALYMARIFGQLGTVDRKRAVSLLECWSRCTLDQRVLIEAMARELAGAGDA